MSTTIFPSNCFFCKQIAGSLAGYRSFFAEKQNDIHMHSKVFQKNSN